VTPPESPQGKIWPNGDAEQALQTADGGAEALAATSADSLPQRLAAIAGFDVEIALCNVGGRALTLARILKTFIAAYGDGEPTLRAGMAQNNPAQMRAGCHSLRGACATLGASGLERQALALETLLESPHDLPALVTRARQIDTELQVLVGQLAAAVAA
jgi:two-component system sensor histidine kinase/response regulator